VQISVITAVYNNGATIAEALESVLGQIFSGIEPVVIDGGSTDGTLEILQCYQGRLGVLVSEPDRGIYDALNKGICKARGDVIGFLHSDDLFFNNQVVSKIAELFADSEVSAVYGDLIYVDSADTGNIVRYWSAGAFSTQKLRWGWMPPHPTLYVRKSVYEKIGLFDTRYRIAADYDWILRFLNHDNYRCAYIEEPLLKMRLGGLSNRSIDLIIQKSREDYRAIKQNGVGGFETLLMKNLQKLPQFFVRPKTMINHLPPCKF
jgi:glycosyltransferase involved in cell wall biosynthesis